MLALIRCFSEKGSGAGMQIRGAASLADVPYWRKPVVFLTTFNSTLSKTFSQVKLKGKMKVIVCIFK
jgi:hypothetical protein